MMTELLDGKITSTLALCYHRALFLCPESMTCPAETYKIARRDFEVLCPPIPIAALLQRYHEFSM